MTVNAVGEHVMPFGVSLDAAEQRETVEVGAHAGDGDHDAVAPLDTDPQPTPAMPMGAGEKMGGIHPAAIPVGSGHAANDEGPVRSRAGVSTGSFSSPPRPR
jgi:hypothetical protein